MSSYSLNQIGSKISPNITGNIIASASPVFSTGELHRVTPSPSPAAPSGASPGTLSEPQSFSSNQTSKRPRDPSDDDGTRKQQKVGVSSGVYLGDQPTLIPLDPPISTEFSGAVSASTFTTTQPVAFPPPNIMGFKNFAGTPDLKQFSGTRGLKIKAFIEGFPDSFKTEFKKFLKNMESGADIILTYSDVNMILNDLSQESPNNYLHWWSQYAQIDPKYLSSNRPITISIAPDPQRKPTQLTKKAKNCWDDTWNGFNLTPCTLEDELMDVLPHSSYSEEFPSNISIELKKKGLDEYNYIFLQTTREPMNPSTLALTATTEELLGMKKEIPLFTVRLMHSDGAHIMSMQLTPNKVVLLHTIETKDTPYSSGDVIALAQSIARSLTAKMIILYDAAKIYWPGSDEYFFYSKAMYPLISDGKKTPLYASSDRGEFKYFEGDISVLDQGEIHDFKGIEYTQRQRILDRGFKEMTMGKFKKLIKNKHPYNRIQDNVVLLDHWRELLVTYNKKRDRDSFSRLINFLNDLVSVKDVQTGNEIDENFTAALNFWLNPEFFYKEVL